MSDPLPDSLFDPLWIGTYHGRHNGTPATVTATRDDTSPEPYAWTCTCGTAQTFPTTYGLDRSAWRHTHPTLMDRLRQRAARYRRALQSRRTGSPTS